MSHTPGPPAGSSGIRIIELNRPAEREQWNLFVARSAFGHFMQTCEWGDFKCRMGWTSSRIGVEQDGRLVAGSQILFRKLPLFPYSIAYVPKGPMIDIGDRALAGALIRGLHEEAKKRRAMFVKIEPDFVNSQDTQERLAELGFKHVPMTNQPRCTFLVDLDIDEKTLLQNMDRNARRLIHRTEEQGVSIEAGTRASLDAFYDIMKDTAKEKSIPLHTKPFFVEAFDSLKNNGTPQLFFAKYQGRSVGALFVFAYKRTSSHLWAGSSTEGRKLSVAYPLHWTAMKWAKENGCSRADLWGIPDEVAELIEQKTPISSEKDEGLWGVYRFKKSFGGRIQCYVGAYDHVYRRAAYRLFEWAYKRKGNLDSISTGIERLAGKRRRRGREE
jgi:lipid II:glycine glycyltransferase (peptidoglycan interpeptide bridge formation enzyme)